MLYVAGADVLTSFAPRERRRDDESGPGPAKRVFAKAVHLRQMASQVDVSDSGM